MIRGIGFDLMHNERIGVLAPNWDDPFFRKTFSEKEYAMGVSAPDPVKWFSQRFAAKEAVFKALGVTCETILWPDIEILSDSIGQPVVYLHGRVAAHPAAQNAKFHITISEDMGLSVAMAVCETIDEAK